MSAALSTQSLCLFGVTLCGIGVINENLFESPAGGGGQGGGNYYNQASNLFGSFVNAAGLGGLNQGQGGGGGGNRRNQPPHQTPCGKVFRYFRDGQGDWKGVIRIRDPDVSQGMNLQVEFTVPQRARSVSWRI